MAQYPNLYNVELTKGPAVVQLQQMFLGDVLANRIGAIVTENGEAVTLGGTCSGTAILSNGGTVAISGTVSGNTCYIDLPSAVYAVEGPVEIFVTNVSGGKTTTLVAAFGNVRRTQTGSIIDPGTIIPSVSALIDAIDTAVASIPADYSALSADVDSMHKDTLTLTLIEGQYVNTAGSIGTASNWSRTPYIPCSDYAGIKIAYSGTLSSSDDKYNAWYKADKTPCSTPSFRVSTNPIEYMRNDMPADAAYFILSGPSSYMASLTVTPVRKSELASASDAFKGFVPANGNTNGLAATLVPDQLSFTILDGESVNRYYRLSTPMFELSKGNSNTLKFMMGGSGYSFKVHFFYADGNGDFQLSRSSGWVSTGVGRYTPHLKTVNSDTFSETHFAVTFSASPTSRYMLASDMEEICKQFAMFEEPSPGKYYRFMSFNMARRWSAFKDHSSADYTQWQIEQYKNLFGDVNPDVLCAQEAIGVTGLYLDYPNNTLLAPNVLEHKFNYNSYYADTRLSSKYAFRDYTNTEYATQYGTSHKQYTKCIMTIDGYRVGVFNTHTEYHGDFNSYLKPQMQELATAMAAAISNGDCDYVIACGDFNAWDNDQFSVFTSAGFQLANCGTFGAKTTWAWENYTDTGDNNKEWNMACTDNIIVSEHVKIQRVGVIPLYQPAVPSGQWPIWDTANDTWIAISDHYPIYIDVSFE